MDDETTVAIETHVAVHTYPMLYLEKVSQQAEANSQDALPWDVWAAILKDWIQDRMSEKERDGG